MRDRASEIDYWRAGDSESDRLANFFARFAPCGVEGERATKKAVAPGRSTGLALARAQLRHRAMSFIILGCAGEVIGYMSTT
jgi:hypothetical protein